ncbi:NusG domain II-containing protein [Candidatus Dependentiae bacterium]|nr:NusG domain II-containing protein [Candidatus Dependentiae bacterium]
MKITFTDKIVLYIIFSAILALILFNNSRNSSSNKNIFVNIKAPNYNCNYDLYTDRAIVVKGKISDVIIKIEKKKVSVAASDCANKTCLHSGEISNINQIITCIPNGIIIKIYADQKDKKIDGITK